VQQSTACGHRTGEPAPEVIRAGGLKALKRVGKPAEVLQGLREELLRRAPPEAKEQIEGLIAQLRASVNEPETGAGAEEDT
jgi:hypothetical protein